ncbi:MAG: Do family serine endopeptidase [Rhodospirillales bacterium]|nr:Do family serine endopeptidase [Rhodospirillales bacterium]
MPAQAQEGAAAASLATPEDGRPVSFAELAREVSPAVVNITTSTIVTRPAGPRGMLPEGSPFEDLFDRFRDRQPQRTGALGSGFVVSADGYIVTNNHVIDGADQIEIEFFSGDRLPATVVGTDPNTDIALLKVEADHDLPFVKFGDSSDDMAEVGDWVMAMGNPLGQGFSVSAGIISARNRALSGTFDDFIQTDAAINQGNSGGPLFNMRGEVIGVNTSILSPDGGSIGIGFSMASNVVKDVVAQLQQFGETRRGYLGVRIQDIMPDMVGTIAGLDKAEGALVTDVPEGPAADAGIRTGDVILEFNGSEVVDTRQLVRMVAAAPVGEAVDVVVLRNGAEMTLGITLGRRETQLDAGVSTGPSTSAEPHVAELSGLSVATITPEIAQEMGLGSDAAGVVITDIDPLSDAAAKGLRPGDVIVEAGQAPVASVDDLKERVTEARDAGRRSILLLLRRGDEAMFMAIGINE